MPINRRQFELGVDTEIEEWMGKIVDFLAEHKDEAFTRSELWKLIYAKSSWPTSVEEAFNKALEKLSQIGDVEIKRIRDKNYYAIR